ncbi:hypothetical protein [Mycolicibacterium sp. HS_4_1]
MLNLGHLLLLRSLLCSFGAGPHDVPGTGCLMAGLIQQIGCGLGFGVRNRLDDACFLAGPRLGLLQLPFGGQ